MRVLIMAGPFLTDISKAWGPDVRERGMPPPRCGSGRRAR